MKEGNSKQITTMAENARSNRSGVLKHLFPTQLPPSTPETQHKAHQSSSLKAKSNLSYTINACRQV
uniref:Uncharacterized protein n=1 Tax=Rhizophora mucronata TaxID=61149 RepID=A0A2P2PXQ1_RHIMU